MNRGKKLLRAVAAALTLALALALCWAVVDVYARGATARLDTGDMTRPIFTRESVAARLRLLWPLGALWLAMMAAAIFAGGLAPERGGAVADAESDAQFLARQVARRPGEDGEEEKAYRRLIRLIGGLCAAVLLVPSVAYLLNGAHFASWELETVMGDMLWAVLPSLAAALAVLTVCARFEEKSFVRERDALRGALRRGEGRKSAVVEEGKAVHRPAWRRWALFALALAMIGLGVFNGGLNDVLVKAINICTECIGLG